MTADQLAPERLAQALEAAGIPFDMDTGAGLLALGAALLRASGLSLTEVQLLASEFYAIAPALARAALEGERES